MRAADLDLQLSHSAGVRHVPRLEARTRIPARAAVTRARFDALVTGGLGGLGLRAAALMQRAGAPSILLLSRSGQFGRGREATRLRAARGVRALACDVSSMEEGARLLPVGRAPALAVLHTAGILKDKLLRGLQIEDVAAVFAPKATGAFHLSCIASQSVLHASLSFSSTEATFYVSANYGQASYVAANGYMDTLARAARVQGRPGRSIQIPPVAEAGMSAATVEAGMMAAVRMCSLDTLAAAVGLFVFPAAPTLTAAGPSQSVLALLPWARIPKTASDAHMARLAPSDFYELEPEAAPSIVAPLPALAPAPLGAGASCVSPAELASLLAQIVQEVTGESGISLDAALMDAGLDSLAATELSNRLRAKLGVPVSPTLAFDHPTARAISTHLITAIQGRLGCWPFQCSSV